ILDRLKPLAIWIEKVKAVCEGDHEAAARANRDTAWRLRRREALIAAACRIVAMNLPGEDVDPPQAACLWIPTEAFTQLCFGIDDAVNRWFGHAKFRLSCGSRSATCA